LTPFSTGSIIDVYRISKIPLKEGGLLISLEPGVLKNSDYYMYTASAQAAKTFFYPLCVGYFYYAPGYHLHRSTYDSFLIMHIKKGQCQIGVGSQTYVAKENQIVLLNCYEPHTYYTTTGWEAVWVHFDGPLARAYFDLITGESGLISSLKDTSRFDKSFQKIYQMYRENASIKEALISKHISDMLTEMLISQDGNPQQPSSNDIIEETAAYINEHLSENLTLESLAERASLSPYYFTRVFKKVTGFTPHEYLIAARINSAKFLLKNTRLSIKEIGYSIGFHSESSFCTTFKKWVETTPSRYRTEP